MTKAKNKKLEFSLEVDSVDQAQGIKPKTWTELDQKAKTMPPRKFFAEGIIDSEGISVVFAPPKSFKSAFIAHVANSASRGISAFEGVKNSHAQECEVLYLDAELYVQDWAERYKFEGDNLKVFTKEDYAQMGIDLGVNEFISFLESHFRDGVRMIVVDNLSIVVPQMSDHKVAAEYIAAMNGLMGRLKESNIDAALVLIAHSTKENIKSELGVTKQSMGGAHAWQKPAQSLVALNRRKDLDDTENGFYIKVIETRRRNNSDIRGRNVLAFRVESDSEGRIEMLCDGIMREEECLGVGGVPDLARAEAKSSDAKMTLMALLEAGGLGTNVSSQFVGEVFNVSSNAAKKYKNAKTYPKAREAFDMTYNIVVGDSSEWVKTWDSIKEDLHLFGGELPLALPPHVQKIINAKRKDASLEIDFTTEREAQF